MLKKIEIDTQKIDLIVVATTSTTKLMPGISYLLQKELQIEHCICFDILAGCSGYINAFDIARDYLALGKASHALVVGCDVLSSFTNPQDMATAIILSDGAGATLLGTTQENKQYQSKIVCNGAKGDILVCQAEEKIKMDGKAIYKYAVTETVKCIEGLLQEADEKLENIKYIVPHQSNIKIIRAIASRLNVEENKLYTNIQTKGNTFCASIPIVLEEMFAKNLLQPKDKIILLGYGGGLNTGSILLEI